MIAALFPLEGYVGSRTVARLQLRLLEEIREPEAAGRSPETARALCAAEFMERREDWLGVEDSRPRLRLEGRICDFIADEPDGFILCRPGLRRVGFMSGCLSCMVISPRRDASVRLRATFEICRFWS